MNAESILIEQLVHGYEKGHALLATSCRLSKKSLAAIGEQSDLSGPLPPTSLIPSYLTAYPVEDSEYYALARTWPDLDAPRSGCVITHTLLIPKAIWATTDSPQAFLSLHKKPDHSSLHLFKTTLPVPHADTEKESKPSITAVESRQLVSKVFQYGLRFIVWFDCENADTLTMSFVKLLWPTLRVHFYVSTYSLQARARIDAELELHFAPRSAQSRFSKIPKECVISKPFEASEGRVKDKWIDELGRYLEEGHPTRRYIEEIREYGHLLGIDPTAIRSLFALRDLTGRLDHTPTAAVGILDIIESLEPTAESSLRSKQRALDTAIEATEHADSETALYCLALIDTRMRRPSFASVKRAFHERVRANVTSIVLRDPKVLFSAFGRTAPIENSAFWDGVRDGLAQVAVQNPGILSNLEQYPKLATFAVRVAPNIAKSYLVSAPEDRQLKIGYVVQWIHGIEGHEERKQLRKSLLATEFSELDFPLLAELLRDLRGEEVHEILYLLVRETNGFEHPLIRKLASEYVIERFPEESVVWAVGSRLTAMGNVPETLATAFPLTSEGLAEILRVDWKSNEDRCEIWSAFVNRLGSSNFPQWFSKLASDDSRIIEPFSGVALLSPRAMRALDIIAHNCDAIPIANSAFVEEFLAIVDGTDVGELFAEKIGLSAISEYLESGIEEPRLVALIHHRQVLGWLNNVSSLRIQSLLTSTCNPQSWQRAWRLLLLLPPTVFHRVISNRAIPVFCLNYRAIWTSDVADNWVQIIERSCRELSHEDSMQLMIEALSFCINNPSLPVGEVVVSAFPEVYRAVTANHHSSVADEMFGYFDWDKGKKLRKAVIESYLNSNWPPEGLALLSFRSQILRKIFSRLRRRWDGERFLSRMAEGLKKHDAPDAASTYQELSSFMFDLDFFESWD